MTLLVSFVSANLAYRGTTRSGGCRWPVAAGREGIQNALRGIRGTSAAYGGGFAALFLATVTTMVIAVARVPLLGIPFWLGRFRFGTLEWAWRSLTWLRRGPFRVSAGAPASFPAGGG